MHCFRTKKLEILVHIYSVKSRISYKRQERQERHLSITAVNELKLFSLILFSLFNNNIAL
jgi:hypothetical protein